MGSSKKRLQQKAENRATETTALEHRRAQDLHDRLGARRGEIGEISRPLVDTGGYDPDRLNEIRATGGYDPEQLADMRLRNPHGWGREIYDEFARTGGFSPGDRENFLRSSGRAATAGFARNRDELTRRLALQGGYMPGYTTSMARIERERANRASEARTDANVALSEQIREGRLAGAGGLESTRRNIGIERLALEGDVAQGRRGVESDVAGNRLQAAQQYFEQLSDNDKTDIANRLAAAGVGRDEIDALLGIDRNKRGGIGIFTDVLDSVSGAVEGVSGAFGGKNGG